MATINKNSWICSNQYFATWEIEFSPIKSIQDVKHLLQFMQEVIQSGENTDILKISSTELTQLYGAPNSPYLEQVKWLVENKQIFSFFGTLFSQNGKNKLTQKSSKIAYFDEYGKIQEEHVADLGVLYHRFHDKDALDIAGLGTVYYASPVEIELGTTVDLNHLKQNLGYTKAYITLYTDIWFPQILDWTDETENRQLINNHELAKLHTPRLNKFLSQVQDFALQAGGTWALVEPEFKNATLYTKMLSNSGINLD